MELVQFIIDQTRKNGKALLSPEQVDLLTTFRDFDVETDWIEGKEVTKIEKLLHKHLTAILDIGTKRKELGMMTSFYSLVDFDRTRVMNGKPYYSQFGKVLTPEVEAEYERLALICDSVSPIVTKWKMMRENRSMTNGKLPKEARIREERLTIKGKLNPFIRTELEKITEKFRLIMLENYISYFRKKSESAKRYFEETATKVFTTYEEKQDRQSMIEYYADVLLNLKEKTFKSDATLILMSEEAARHRSEEFFFKMADKLGGLPSESIKGVNEHIRSGMHPWESFIRFEFNDGSGFLIENKIVLNMSPLGTPFYQYPTTFHDVTGPNGVKIVGPYSENLVKEIFIKNLQK